ncbi:MAG: proton-conducting transporter membrane subunit [Planctomycetota bacterium]
MEHEWLLWSLIALPALPALPVLGGLAAAALPRPRWALAGMCVTIFGASALSLYAAVQVFAQGAIFAANDWLFLDALSAYHLIVMALVFALSSAYAWTYFNAELAAGHLTLTQTRIFVSLWCGAFSAMTLVLISNNLGIMWVGIEATTLFTAFLICVHQSRESLEAMWKYILMCSVGVAFAFIGTLLAVTSAHELHLPTHDVMLWTKLRESAPLLDPVLIKAAFIFLIVGYGTKAGLAPMHNWLPDAHSQAPAPVSAIFSGFMLNAALYCIMRYIPIVESATGCQGWGSNLLVGFGLLSTLVAAGFIIFQRDLKRLLAYSSVEHIGIIALGLGLGGLGTFAALFHTLNHSICKTLAFFAAGRLGQIYGTHDMTRMHGSLRRAPVWGIGMFGAILALIGVAPFAIFMSELLIVKAAIDSRSFITLVVFLLSSSIVFIGALGHAIPLAWGRSSASENENNTRKNSARATTLETTLVAFALLSLLVLGVWISEPLRAVLWQASRVIQDSGATIAGATP